MSDSTTFTSGSGSKMTSRLLAPKIDLTFIKCVALAIALSPTTGCYTYSSATRPLSAGNTVVLESTSAGNDIAFPLGTDDTLHVTSVTQVTGQVISTNSERMLLRVESLHRRGGSSAAFEGVSVHGTSFALPFARSVASIPSVSTSTGQFRLTTRKVDKAKTTFAIAGIVLVLGAAMVVAIGSSLSFGPLCPPAGCGYF